MQIWFIYNDQIKSHLVECFVFLLLFNYNVVYARFAGTSTSHVLKLSRISES